jgi:hypothetical protein
MSIEVISKARVVEEGYSTSSSSSSSLTKTQLENGCYHRIAHHSSSTNTKMIFGLFLPSNYKNEGMSFLVVFLFVCVCSL